MIFTERARAKINLTLHIKGRRPDGWHELESLVVFGAMVDVLIYDTDQPIALTLSGPYAQGLSAGDDNLILKAAYALRELHPQIHLGAFHLIKNLPHAAGIGGGSADAAACLRVLARAHNLNADDAALALVACRIGADVSVCLLSRASMMRGVGEICTPLPSFPALYAVVVNPAVPLDTKAVFAKMNLPLGADYNINAHPVMDGLPNAADVMTALRRGRNDMEDVASVLAPIVGDVLAALGAARGCQLARMSGSGASCFGLFASRHQARAAARAIASAHPTWWVKASLLR